MLTQLPSGLVKYSETALFTEETVPSKLTSAHDTKPGVWGKLMVEEGALDYIIVGPPIESTRINTGQFGIIEPTVLHYVTPVGSVAFRVEFYRGEK